MSIFRTFSALAILSSLPFAARAGQTIEVNPSVHYQKFEGWGTSLAWWAKIVGGFPRDIRERYMQQVFDPVNGLGITVVRYNIGGGENPSVHKLSLRAQISGFEPSPGNWNWDADPEQRWVLHQAKDRGATIFEAFSNSPPYWMTTSGSVTGATDGKQDNLAPSHEQDFADYLVRTVEHFGTKEGISFRTLEPLNEPSSTWWHYGNNQEGCHFGRAGQSRIIEAVGRGLEQARLPTTVSAPDENRIDDTLASYLSYRSATKMWIGQINTHSYQGKKRTELAQVSATENKVLWQSEYGDGDPTGLTMAARILEDMNLMHPAAWIYWQAVDGDRWGLLTNAVDGQVSEPRRGKKYWVFANFSRFIRPGMVFIQTNDPHSLAALDAAGQKLVVVTINANKNSENVSIDLSRFNTKTAKIAAYRTSPVEDLADVDGPAVADQSFTNALPELSVTTFVITGLSPVRN